MVKSIHFEYDMRRRERESSIRVKRGEREGERESTSAIVFRTSHSRSHCSVKG